MITGTRVHRPRITTEITDYACLNDLRIEGLSDHAFISRIFGRGMEGAGVSDGDWLIFDPCHVPENGDIVYLTVYGQPMCRRVFFNPGPDGQVEGIRIRREDNITPDLVTDTEDTEIQGVFIGLVRNIRKRKKGNDYQFFSPLQAEQACREEKRRKAGCNPENPAFACPGKSGAADPSVPITSLGLPARITNCLTRIGMRSAGDILDVPDREALLAIPGIGKDAYEKIIPALDARGYDIRHLRW